MALRDAFVNMAKNAAAGAAQQAVTSVANGLRSGLGGSASSSASSALQTNYRKQESDILLYPSDVGTNMHQASYILFARHEVSGGKVEHPKKVKVATVFKTIGSPVGGRRVPDVEATRKKQQEADAARISGRSARGGANKGGSSGSLTLQRRNIKKTGTFIGLYMPPAVNVKYAMDFAESEIGVATEALYSLFKDYQAGTLGMGSVMNAVKGQGKSVVQATVLSKIGGLPGLAGAADTFALESGTIITPRTEMMFRGIGRREFSFTFTFIPKDHIESEIVHKIVEQFKLGMTPEFTNAGSTRELSIPDVFSIQYMHINGPNNYLNKIGKCYLKGLDVTYGGDKFVTYNADAKGAPPQKTALTLSFQELEIMDRNNIKDGF